MIKFETENDLEMLLYQSFKEDGLLLVNGEFYDDCIRQFDTKSYGIPDLVFYSDEIEIDENNNKTVMNKLIHVVELKNEPIKMSHIAQIARYKTYFERATSEMHCSLYFSLVVPEGIGKSDDVCWVINSLEDIDVYEFSLDPREGIEFHASGGWYKTIEDFSPVNNLFNDEETKGGM